MITVVHVIIGLERGGAETMLRRLVEAHLQPESTYRHIVISLTGVGYHGSDLREKGVEVYALGLNSPLSLFRVFRVLVSILRRVRPDVVQTWMYHADLLGGLAARLAHSPPVIWGIHTYAIDHGVSRTTRLVRTLCAWASSFLPVRILCVAEAAFRAHVAAGYDAKKFSVLPNGFDVSKLPLSPSERERVRTLLGIGGNGSLVGIVGRFNPDKDFRNFIWASANVLAEKSDVRFLMVGNGTGQENSQIDQWISELKIDPGRFIRLGASNDVLPLMSAMDVYCSSSRSEAFPLVIGEAMLMACPCVATDVGDTARLLGDSGILVPPMDSSALGRGILTVLQMEPAQRSHLGRRARERIVSQYSMQAYMSKLEQIYADVVREGKNG